MLMAKLGGGKSTSSPRVIEHFHISGINSSDGENFVGLIDDVEIYETMLTLGEIQKHYAEGLERHQNLAINQK